MTTEATIIEFLKVNNIPCDEMNIKNCSTHLVLINHWAKSDSEIPYIDSVHEPHARANYDLMKAKATSLGIREMDEFSFNDIFEDGKGMDAVRKLYNCIVVEQKTLSPLKRQSYDGRRAKYGTALNWKKELELVQESLKENDSNSEEEDPHTNEFKVDNTSSCSTDAKSSEGNSRRFLFGVASLVGVAAVIAAGALRG